MTRRAVTFSASAAKTLSRLDRATRDRIVLKVDQLAVDPDSLANNVKPLKGAKGLWRLRVGDWRIFYTETFVVVSVVRIASRGSAYS